MQLKPVFYQNPRSIPFFFDRLFLFCLIYTSVKTQNEKEKMNKDNGLLYLCK